MTRPVRGYPGIFTPSYQLTLKPFPDILKTEPHHMQFKMCVCVCDGLRVIPGEHCQERQGWRVSLQTLIPPETETQSVAS